MIVFNIFKMKKLMSIMIKMNEIRRLLEIKKQSNIRHMRKDGTNMLCNNPFWSYSTYNRDRVNCKECLERMKNERSKM